MITTGDKFGRLTALAECPGRRWKCRCECEREVICYYANLQSLRTKSCGCLNREILIIRNTKHGRSQSREYGIWSNMKTRCSTPNAVNWSRYGGRGITVCDRWIKSFQAFFDDMGPCPPGYTLERKDNDGEYSLSNCRWATPAEQNRNTRSNRSITAFGETRILKDWAVKASIPVSTLHRWLKVKTLEQILSQNG